MVQASRLGLTLIFPVLSLQPGHGTGSWALQMLVNTTWRSQMPNSLTMLPMSARPQRLHCVPGGPNSPCSVMTPDLFLPTPFPSSVSQPFPPYLAALSPLLSLLSLVLSQQLLTQTSSKAKGLESSVVKSICYFCRSEFSAWHPHLVLYYH